VPEQDQFWDLPGDALWQWPGLFERDLRDPDYRLPGDPLWHWVDLREWDLRLDVDRR